MAKCSGCGATVSPHEQNCPYCGIPNADYRPPADEVNELLEQAMQAYQQERYARSIDYYNQAIAIDPEIFSAYFFLASGLTILGRREEAIAAMKKAQAIRPGNFAVCYNLGLLHKQIGLGAEARAYLEETLKILNADPSIPNRAQLKKNVEKELAAYKRWKFF